MDKNINEFFLGKKVAIATIGCKLNQFETVAIGEKFQHYGSRIVDFKENADIYVVNTCTVTATADHKSRMMARRAIKINPEAIVAVTGCYSMRAESEPSAIQGVTLVIDNHQKFSSPEIIYNFFKGENQRSATDATFPNRFITGFKDYTRAFVKIQDGCNTNCTFCVVPGVRGRSRSLSEHEILRQIEMLVKAGYGEIVLTGVNIGMYGRDLGSGENLEKLIESILGINDLKRLRLSSIEPTEFSGRLIELITKCERVAQHLHIPLQSGDARILRDMNRSYSPEYYKDLVQELKRLSPEMGIGADVMVGFPGESEDNFRNTLDLVNELPVTYLHVFNYSRRAGTPACSFTGQIDPEVRKQRSAELILLGKEKNFGFRKSFIGKELEVLFENRYDKYTDSLTGLSGNYLRIQAKGGRESMNRFLKVIIKKTDSKHTFGDIKK